MTIIDRLLDLVNSALDSLDNPDDKLSTTIRKAIRIARLRNDYDNLWWLEYEMLSFDDDEAKNRLIREFIPHYSKDDFLTTKKQIVEAWISERQISSVTDDKGEERVCAWSVEEIEINIDNLTTEMKNTVTPNGLHPLDLYFVEKAYRETRTIVNNQIFAYQAVLSHISHRVHKFLSHTEKQLVYGQINSDIFERNRQYVDRMLRAVAPEALDQFIAAYKRVNENNPEAGSQALLSCRRILKSVADKVYPAREETITGSDGKTRKLTEDRYISRLWQFVAEEVKGEKSGELLLTQIKDTGDRIDRVYELASKGVHTDVSENEVNQCVIQTYLLIGDILRLSDNSSAIDSQ